MYQGPRYYDPGSTENFGNYDPNGYMERQEYPGQDFYESSAKISTREEIEHRIASIKIEKNEAKLNEWLLLFQALRESEVQLDVENANRMKKYDPNSRERCEYILSNADIAVDAYDSILSLERLYSSKLISPSIIPTMPTFTAFPLKGSREVKRPKREISDAKLGLSDVLQSEPFAIKTHFGRKDDGENVVVVRIKGTGKIALSMDDIEALESTMTEFDYKFLTWKIISKIWSKLGIIEQVPQSIDQFDTKKYLDSWFVMGGNKLSPPIDIAFFADIPLYKIADHLEIFFRGKDETPLQIDVVTITAFTYGEFIVPGTRYYREALASQIKQAYAFALDRTRHPILERTYDRTRSLHPERFIRIASGPEYEKLNREDKQVIVRTLEDTLGMQGINLFVYENGIVDMDAFLPFYEKNKRMLTLPKYYQAEAGEDYILPRAFMAFLYSDSRFFYLPEVSKKEVITKIYEATKIKEAERILREYGMIVINTMDPKGGLIMEEAEDPKQGMLKEAPIVEDEKIDDLEQYARYILRNKTMRDYNDLVKTKLSVIGRVFIDPEREKKDPMKPAGVSIEAFMLSSGKEKKKQITGLTRFDDAQLDAEELRMQFFCKDLKYTKEPFLKNKSGGQEMIAEAYKRDFISTNVFLSQFRTLDLFKENERFFVKTRTRGILDSELEVIQIISQYITGLIILSSGYDYGSKEAGNPDNFLRNFIVPWLYDYRMQVEENVRPDIIEDDSVDITELNPGWRVDPLIEYRESLKSEKPLQKKWDTLSFTAKDVVKLPSFNENILIGALQRSMSLIYSFKEKYTKETHAQFKLENLLRISILCAKGFTFDPNGKRENIVGADEFVNATMREPFNAEALSYTFRTTSIPIYGEDDLGKGRLKTLNSFCTLLLSRDMMPQKKYRPLIRAMRLFVSAYVLGNLVNTCMFFREDLVKFIDAREKVVMDANKTPEKKYEEARELTDAMKMKENKLVSNVMQAFISVLTYKYYYDILEFMVDVITGYYTISLYKAFAPSKNDKNIGTGSEVRQRFTNKKIGSSEREEMRISREYTHMYGATSKILSGLIDAINRLLFAGDASLIPDSLKLTMEQRLRRMVAEETDNIIEHVTERLLFGISEYMRINSNVLTKAVTKKKKSHVINKSTLTTKDAKVLKTAFEFKLLVDSLADVIMAVVMSYQNIIDGHITDQDTFVLEMYDFSDRKRDGRDVLLYVLYTILYRIDTATGTLDEWQVTMFKKYDALLKNLMAPDYNVPIGDDLTLAISTIIDGQTDYIRDQLVIIGKQFEATEKELRKRDFLEVQNAEYLVAKIECENDVILGKSEIFSEGSIFSIQRKFGEANIKKTTYDVVLTINQDPKKQEWIYRIVKNRGKEEGTEITVAPGDVTKITFENVPGIMLKYESPKATKFYFTKKIGDILIQRERISSIHESALKSVGKSDEVAGYPLFSSSNIINIVTELRDIDKKSRKDILEKIRVIPFSGFITIEFDANDVEKSSRTSRSTITGFVKFIYLFAVTLDYVNAVTESLVSNTQLNTYIAAQQAKIVSISSSMKTIEASNDIIFKKRFKREEMGEEKKEEVETIEEKKPSEEEEEVRLRRNRKGKQKIVNS